MSDDENTRKLKIISQLQADNRRLDSLVQRQFSQLNEIDDEIKSLIGKDFHFHSANWPAVRRVQVTLVRPPDGIYAHYTIGLNRVADDGKMAWLGFYSLKAFFESITYEEPVGFESVSGTLAFEPDSGISIPEIAEEARQIAGQCWCDPQTKDIEMDTRLAHAFAIQLERVMIQNALLQATRRDDQIHIKRLNELLVSRERRTDPEG